MPGRLRPESCLSEGPPQIDEYLFVDVLAVWRLQHFGLGAKARSSVPEVRITSAGNPALLPRL
ncbi:MAG TPA: hypothetical protein VFI54_00830 [Solirubrobacteraceae bacterium]|nr:hypothetical protein [Solirubrobacteraceae bacterium]